MLPADHAQCSQAKEESDVRKWLKSGMPVGMTPVKARPAAAAAAAAADAEARSARPAAPTTGGDDRIASPRISRALFMEVQATLTAKVQQVMHRGLGRTALRDLHRDGLGLPAAHLGLQVAQLEQQVRSLHSEPMALRPQVLNPRRRRRRHRTHAHTPPPPPLPRAWLHPAHRCIGVMLHVMPSAGRGERRRRAVRRDGAAAA